MFEYVFCFLQIGIVLSALAVLIWLCRHCWQFFAGLLVVVVLFAGIIFLPGALAEPVVPGNIDLNNRIVIWNGDGTYSTEISFSVEIDGLEVLLPLIVDGKLVSEEEAIQHFFETGEHLGMFASVEECDAYAVELHLRQESLYGESE